MSAPQTLLRGAPAAPAGPSSPDALAARLAPRPARVLVLLAVLVCAACGLVYELALIALGSYLVGGSVLQTSLVVSIVLAAMGVGALAAKRLVRWPVLGFAGVELALATVGGFSVPALYAAFAWLGVYTAPMLVAAAAVGTLIGAEIPLLMALVQRIRAQEASDAVADLSAADYLGALVGGLAFPLVLLPTLGLLRGPLLVAAVNVVAAGSVCVWLFGAALSRRDRLVVLGGCVAVAALLAWMGAAAGAFEVTARQRLYRDPVVHAERSAYQEIVLTRDAALAGLLGTGGRADVRLFLDGDLQFASTDEHRYHEALVHPVLAGSRERVLVLGGGDGLALREILRYPDVEHVDLVDLDPAVVDLARTHPTLRAYNEGALDDPRVEVTNADALPWLRDAVGPDGPRYDAVVMDFPDPDGTETAKLYTIEFYALAARTLTPSGRMVVQAGSPYFAPRSFWSIRAALHSAGLPTTPYHVDVPSFGDWGFVLAGPGRDVDADAALPPGAPPIGPLPALPTGPEAAAARRAMRFLDEAVLAAATVFPPDQLPRSVEASTLLDPVILEYQRDEWRDYS